MTLSRTNDPVDRTLATARGARTAIDAPQQPQDPADTGLDSYLLRLVNENYAGGAMDLCKRA